MTSVSLRVASVWPRAWSSGADLAEVVDLAVEHDRDGAVFIAERLMAAFEVDDGEPPMAEANRALDEQTLAVGTAMDHDVAHRGDLVGVHRPCRRS